MSLASKHGRSETQYHTTPGRRKCDAHITRDASSIQLVHAMHSEMMRQKRYSYSAAAFDLYPSIRRHVVNDSSCTVSLQTDDGSPCDSLDVTKRQLYVEFGKGVNLSMFLTNVDDSVQYSIAKMKSTLGQRFFNAPRTSSPLQVAVSFHRTHTDCHTSERKRSRPPWTRGCQQNVVWMTQ